MPSESKATLFLHDEVGPMSGIMDIGDLRIGYFILRNKQKTTEENEDTLFISPKETSLILGVADGAGGHPRGRDASYQIGQYIQSAKDENMYEMIDNINQEIISLKVGAKSTLALAKIIGKRTYFYSVGDSEIIYWNSHGTEIFSSIPHSMTGHKIRADVITQEDSLDDPDRYLVNHLMGDEFIRIESTTSIEMKKGHTFLIGTDGLFDNLSHDHLTKLISGGSFENSMEQIAVLCHEQDKKKWIKDDDIAFLLARKIKA
jgi:serine/threonine protein phosphatase PrpC